MIQMIFSYKQVANKRKWGIEYYKVNHDITYNAPYLTQQVNLPGSHVIGTNIFCLTKSVFMLHNYFCL